MKHLVVLLVVTVLLLPACEKEAPPPPPESAPPPPPSVEDIYREVSPLLQPLRDRVIGAPTDEMAYQKMLADLRGAKGKHQGTDNGKEAMARLATEIDGIITQARTQEFWGIVARGCEVFEILQPGNIKTKRYAEMAAKELARPRVRVKGFHEDKATNETYVFLEVKLPNENWKRIDPVRVGDEFLDPPNTLRLVEILGDKKGVRLEYLGIEGDVFEVKGP